MSVAVMDIGQLCLLVVPARSCSFIVSVNRTIKFWRACSLCGPRSIIFAPSEAMVQMMPLIGTQINYMPDKCHVIIIIINTQGQIYFKKDCLT